MIQFLKGTLADVFHDRIIIEVNGVGYGVYMSPVAISCLPPSGDQVKVHTYLNVKEDAMQLFGFLTRDDLDIFKMVIAVNGIGPKGGLAILSVLSPDELRYAVLAGDAKAIAKAPGIGKKTAEKLILELKDKLKIEDVLDHVSNPQDTPLPAVSSSDMNDAVEAMIALGYQSTEAIRAVRSVENYQELSSEELLKKALRHVMF